jgi:hypothetical protein
MRSSRKPSPSTGAASVKDMGKVMGVVKAKAAGRTDMGAVSARIKAALSAADPAPRWALPGFVRFRLLPGDIALLAAPSHSAR